MLTPHPAFLRRLVDEYETALADDATGTDAARGTRAQDLAYTLCVSTGTRDVRQALEEARRLLAAAGTPAPAPRRRAQAPAPAHATAAAHATVATAAPLTV
ncbi:DUF5133 domain-containing protein [Streptomyces sp. NPDC047017]|uniref:DUF5133 domain-containing protein n=1 Tax=Streptomyces sp. NPDC047017 TaxID=3155024 RepID=UPI00340230F5